jgi:uncharacterized protein YciI
VSVYAVTVVNGPGWDPSAGRREQSGWDEHAAFMEQLLADGTVILGGPLGDGADGTEVLLVVEAADETELRAQLGPDPWHVDGTVRIGRIQAWTLWLDSRA